MAVDGGGREDDSRVVAVSELGGGMTEIEHDDFEVTAEARRNLDFALGKWLESCQDEAKLTWASGHGGYFGSIKICAYAEDAGVVFRIERTFIDQT